MGYFCCFCDAIADAVDINHLIHYFHYRHSISALQKCPVVCGQSDCPRTLDNVQALRI